MQELFSHPGMEILHVHENWIELLSLSLSRDDLRSLSLHPCHQVANIGRLISMEMEQNWDSLQGHLDLYKEGEELNGRVWLNGEDRNITAKDTHRVLRSAVDEASNARLLPYHFNHYVSFEYNNYYVLLS